MKTQFTRLLKLTTAIAAMSLPMYTYADDTAPTPPPAPAAPTEVHEVIVVRPDAPSVYVTGQAMAETVKARQAKMVKAAFLGVGVGAAPEVLTEQLKLPQGVGLVVEFVEDGSPAAKAGLQPKDVLHKLDEQLLINPQQFATLIRTFKPSDNVKLTVIRKGDVVTLNASLIERELPELTASAQAFQFTTGSPLTASFNMEMPRELRVEGMNRENIARAPANSRIIRVMPGSKSKITKIDDGLRIELESADGVKTLKVIDKDGKSVFDGPFNTKEEIEKLPADYREKVKAMEAGVELKEVPATSPAEPKADADVLTPSGPTT